MAEPFILQESPDGTGYDMPEHLAQTVFDPVNHAHGDRTTRDENDSAGALARFSDRRDIGGNVMEHVPARA